MGDVVRRDWYRPVRPIHDIVRDVRNGVRFLPVIVESLQHDDVCAGCTLLRSRLIRIVLCSVSPDKTIATVLLKAVRELR